MAAAANSKNWVQLWKIQLWNQINFLALNYANDVEMANRVSEERTRKNERQRDEGVGGVEGGGNAGRRRRIKKWLQLILDCVGIVEKIMKFKLWMAQGTDAPVIYPRCCRLN